MISSNPTIHPAKFVLPTPKKLFLSMEENYTLSNELTFSPPFLLKLSPLQLMFLSTNPLWKSIALVFSYAQMISMADCLSIKPLPVVISMPSILLERSNKKSMVPSLLL